MVDLYYKIESGRKLKRRSGGVACFVEGIEYYPVPFDKDNECMLLSPSISERIIQSDLKRAKQSTIIKPKIAKKIFLRRHQIKMEMQFAFDEMTTSLVRPAYFSSEEDKEMDVDILSVSVEGTGCHSDDNDIEVIACYRHVPIAQKNDYAPQNDDRSLKLC